MSNWRHTREYRLVRAKAIRRDKHCVVCGKRKFRQVHHINNGSHHPKERCDLSNLVTLCKSCHSQLHNNYKYSYRYKTTKKDWDNFQDLARHYIQVGKLHYIQEYSRNR